MLKKKKKKKTVHEKPTKNENKNHRNHKIYTKFKGMHGSKLAWHGWQLLGCLQEFRAELQYSCSIPLVSSSLVSRFHPPADQPVDTKKK
jgi:hypothetical protein